MSKPKPGKSAKKRKAPKKKNAQRKPPREDASTPNGKLIQDLMAKREVKGHYKDYVMYVGNRIIDWTGAWDAHNEQGEPVGFDGVLLIHMSKLKDHLGEKFASRYWKPGIGRVALKKPQKQGGQDGSG